MASTTRILVGRRMAVTSHLCAAEKKMRRASRARRRLPFCRSRAAKLGRSPIFPKAPATPCTSDSRSLSGSGDFGSNRAVYRDNDEGYLDPKRHNHIWVLDVP